MSARSLFAACLNGGIDVLKDTKRVWFFVLKIVIPLAILVRFLTLLGVLKWVATLIAPLMSLVGLPGEMGLVWITGACSSIYAAIVVYVGLAHDVHLTTAQVSVLCCMILTAHALPIELSIVKKSGPRLRYAALLRIGGAFLFGAIVFQVSKFFPHLQKPATLHWTSAPYDPSWKGWFLSQLANDLKIGAVIFALLLLMKILKHLGIVEFFKKLLAPVLSVFGMSRAAAPVTIIGMILGMVYGGALIVDEAKSGELSPRDVVYALSLLSLCHSLIEDTLILMLIGGDFLPLFWFRLCFCVVGLFIIVQLTKNWSDSRFESFFFARKVL